MSDRFQNVFSDITREVDLEHFERYILHSSQHANQLYSTIRDCQTHGFPRFNVWRMLLEVMPIQGDWDQKKDSLDTGRQKWQKVKQEARTGVVNPSPTKEVVNVPKNPLMKMAAKPEKKKEVITDEFLRSEIKKDVDRTYQQLTFFQDQQIMKLMADVLFVWCKMNADISYQQGMNEVLASIVYVYFKEAVPGNFESSTELEIKYLFLNSIDHVEADIYIVFERIMEIHKDMFKLSLDEETKEHINPNSKNNTPILQRILILIDQRLKATDLELFRIIKLQDVKTKTFLLKWIRCIHTRQFGLFNSLYIWDSMFLDAFESPLSKNKHQYEFIDAMCLAMFIYMRAIAQTRQTANEIYQVYSKFPALEGQYLFELIKLAWSVCEEMRTQVSNRCNNSNWFENQGKSKKLGLMEKPLSPPPNQPKKRVNQYHVTVKDAEPSIKKEKKAQVKIPVDPEEPQAQKKSENNSHLKNPVKDEPTMPISPANRDKSKTSDNVFFKETTSLKKQQTSGSKIQSNGVVQFEDLQLRGIIETLKQSININTDTQSRALSNKALKLLESKVRK